MLESDREYVKRKYSGAPSLAFFSLTVSSLAIGSKLYLDLSLAIDDLCNYFYQSTLLCQCISTIKTHIMVLIKEKCKK